MTEEELSTTVKQLAKLYGWRIHHERPARTQKGWRTPMEGDPGFPDWVLCKHLEDNNYVCLIAELKSAKGKPTDEQRTWLSLLNKVKGIFVFLWQPSDIDDISLVLQSKGLPDIIKLWTKNVLFAANHTE